MGRKNYAIDQACITAFQAQGRGAGTGEDYRPWLKVGDVPSRGRSHRTWGIKTQRVHHTLSDGEHNVLMALEADTRTIDIREQYPMDALETYRAARELGYRPPATIDGTPYVLTIDFFVVQQIAGHVVNRPLTFKWSMEQLTSRQKELLAIAYLYWKWRGETLEIIDESFYDLEVVRKYSEVRAYYYLEEICGLDHALIHRVAEDFSTAVVQKDHGSLRGYCSRRGREWGLGDTTMFDIVRHLLAHRIFKTDFSGPTRLPDYALAQFAIA